MNPLTLCRAHLFDTLEKQISIPVKAVGDTTAHPARVYCELRLNGPKTRPGIDNLFTLNILIIALPHADTNAYCYIDTANQIHDLVLGLAVSITGVGCLTQQGVVRVQDFEFVDTAKTIQQAVVTTDFILEA